MDPIEPIAVSDVRVHLRREPFDFHAVARNSKVHGASGLVVRAVRLVLLGPVPPGLRFTRHGDADQSTNVFLCRAKLTEDAMDMEIDVFFPTMFIEGDFKMEGKIGSFPFSGRGPWNVTICKHVSQHGTCEPGTTETAVTSRAIIMHILKLLLLLLSV